jgi:hypothetical protein
MQMQKNKNADVFRFSFAPFLPDFAFLNIFCSDNKSSRLWAVFIICSHLSSFVDPDSNPGQRAKQSSYLVLFHVFGWLNQTDQREWKRSTLYVVFVLPALKGQ